MEKWIFSENGVEQLDICMKKKLTYTQILNLLQKLAQHE